MADIAIRLSEAGADLEIVADDLARDEGLRPAVLISLFSDARAPEGAELPGGPDTDPRGWWADLDRERGIGSTLWVEGRGKITTELLERMRAAAAASLAWLTEDQVAELVEVTATRRGGSSSSTVDLEVRITRGTATRYGQLWAGVEDYDLTLEGLRVALLFR